MKIKDDFKREKIKLSLIYSLINLFIIFILIFSFYFIYSKAIYKNFDSNLMQRNITLNELLSTEEDLFFENLKEVQNKKTPFEGNDEIIILSDLNKNIIYTFGNIDLKEIEIKENQFSYGTYNEEVNNKVESLKLKAYTTKIKNMPLFITVARKYDEVKDSLNLVLISFLSVTPFILLFIIYISYKLSTQMVKRIEESYKKLKEFTENASHELKTPLSTIKANIDVALSKNIDDIEYYRKKLNIINSSVERMTNIIKRMFFISKIERDIIEDKKEKVNLKNLLIDLKDKFIDLANKKSISIELNISDEIEIYTNHSILEEILSIILENGIEFNKENGYVIIEVKSDNDNVYISIEDSGIGIAKEDLPYIFDRFYRGEKSRSRESGGAGLGLSIAYELSKKIYAKLSVESEENKGTKFTIILKKNEWFKRINTGRS